MEEKGRPAGEQSRAEEPLKITAAEMRLHLLTADLPEEEDIVSSYRRREAAWISLITHALIIALLIFVPKWSFNRPVIVPIKQKQDTTFLSLPDDALKVKPPKTTITSDKNRIAQTKTPTVDKETLRKLMDQRKPVRRKLHRHRLLASRRCSKIRRRRKPQLQRLLCSPRLRRQHRWKRPNLRHPRNLLLPSRLPAHQ